MDGYDQLFMGIDVGSSFIKISVMDRSQKVIRQLRVPQNEMQIQSKQQGWAQQDPNLWWHHIQQGLSTIFQQQQIKSHITGIGISYQMHGLVIVDQHANSLANSIIWCDSRTTQIGQQLYSHIQQHQLTQHLLNHPSNFTICKLLWIKRNNIQLYNKIYKIMLPGDYIALKLTGTFSTTRQALSEAILWDYCNNRLSYQLLDICDISHSLIPQIVDNFEYQCQTSSACNIRLGIDKPIPIYYRAGDQPNNAFSLNVIEPGQIAATGGTSGVIFAISSRIQSQQILKYNSFLHVNHTPSSPRIGKLLCINGCGIIYRWLRQHMFAHLTYQQMNHIAEGSQSQGMIIIPFGNGAQRMLANQDIKCHIFNIDFNRHSSSHIIRSAIQGIAFSFVYGANLMREKQIQIQTIKAGKGNIFQCSLFCSIVSTLLNAHIQIYLTNGAEGTAKAALLGHLNTTNKAKAKQFKVKTTKVNEYSPIKQQYMKLQQLYEKWKNKVDQMCVES